MCVYITSELTGGLPPASTSNIFQSGLSLSRPATFEPAEPAPTTMKSYSASSRNDQEQTT